MPRWSLALLILSTIALGTRGGWAEQPAHARTQLPSATSVEGKTSPASTIANSSSQRDPIQIRLPQRSKLSAAANRNVPKRRATTSTFTVISSLAIVVGIFLLLAWLTRRAAPNSSQALPSDVVQVLGRAPLAARNMMHLVRIGNKLILVSLTNQGAATLTEITDPQEVERLSARCERARPGSISATFRNVLHQFGEERTSASYLGDGEQRA
jgi:flagellar biogenesis protein FliO